MTRAVLCAILMLCCSSCAGRAPEPVVVRTTASYQLCERPAAPPMERLDPELHIAHPENLRRLTQNARAWAAHVLGLESTVDCYEAQAAPPEALP